ncbi:MAG: SH3 domain-containing protein [Christensenellaceae bacterium]|nr:SH3 domain-containing protein [Christensenellaceae bacterium]
MKHSYGLKAIKILSITMALAIAVMMLPINVAYAFKYPTEGMATDSVNMRKYANTNSSLVYRLKQGDIVTLLGTKGSFYHLKYNNYEGYALKDFIQIGTEPTPTPEPPKYVSLSKGSSGYEVTALQEALTELKFYDAEIDGKFGNSTFDALKSFQKANKLKQSGVADDKTQKLLYEGRPNNSKGRQQTVKTLAPLLGIMIKAGSKGQAVKSLQLRLKELGYYSGEINGVNDTATSSAIKAFQRNNGLKVTGNANADAQTLINSILAIPADATPTPKPTATPKMPTKKLSKGDIGKSVQYLQEMLTGMGYFTGKIDGKYGSSTVDAVKAFQKSNGLKADGVAGDETITIMYSGNAIYHSSKATPAPLSTATPSPINYPQVQENIESIRLGATGDMVLYLQRKLTELGYYNARMDGNYLADDQAAIMAFQKDNNLKNDGIAGYQTLKLLFSKTTTTSQSFSESSITPPPVKVSLRLGDSGNEVTKLQQRLIELNYLSGRADGKYGESTKNAVMAFQAANKLSRDGVAGATTLETLYSSNAVGKKSQVTNSTILKRGDNSPAVRELQTALINLGYLTGTADGKFGSNTLLALMKFQARNGLKNDGIAGSETLSKLKSEDVKIAQGAKPTPKPEAPSISLVPDASSIRYANWYTEIRARIRKYPNITVYDYKTGESWQLKVFSTGSHADAEPPTAADTEKMLRAFGGKTTWTPKAVWILMSDGRNYIATLHNTPHGTYSNKNNNFKGHMCIHFPRTLAQVQAIGPYAVLHQDAVDLGWKQTQQLVKYK